MSNHSHDQFEELDALVLLHGASDSKLRELKTHLEECSSCRREYGNFTEKVLPRLSVPDVSNEAGSSPTSRGEELDLDSRFFERAQAAGVSFSQGALAPFDSNGSNFSRSKPTRARLYRVALAASLFGIIGLGSYFAGIRHDRSRFVEANINDERQRATVETHIPGSSAAAPGSRAAVAPHEKAMVATLEDELRDTKAQLENEQKEIASERSTLEEQLRVGQQQRAASEQETSASRQTIGDLRSQLDQVQAKADSNQNAFIEAQVKLNELAEQMKAQTASSDGGQQNGSDRELHNMLVARNLHIIDVFDTDGDGKTKSVFGRIFFTENKRLLFYAYDLNESRLKDSKYSYRVWGVKEGSERSARALGIFSSDDKAQRRWIFKYEDPKVLSEIDSLFVTLEPTDRDLEHPRGQKLMYAYLRNDVNHP